MIAGLLLLLGGSMLSATSLQLARAGRHPLDDAFPIAPVSAELDALVARADAALEADALSRGMREMARIYDDAAR